MPRFQRNSGFALALAGCVAAAMLVVVSQSRSNLGSGSSFARRGRSVGLRGGGCSGFYSNFGSEAKNLLHGADGDRFSTATQVNLTATGGDLKATASKSFLAPGEIRFEDGYKAKTSDAITYRHTRDFDDFSGFFELDSDSSFRVGVKKSAKCDGGNCEGKLTTSGSSLDAKLKYWTDKLKATADLGGINAKGLGSVKGSVALSNIQNLDGVTLGANMELDPNGDNGMSVKRHSVGAKYVGDDYTLSGSLQGRDSLSASFYKSIDADTKLAAQATYNLDSKAKSFLLGLERAIDADSSVSGRVSDQGKLGLAYNRNLRPGVSLTAAADFDLQNVNEKPKTGVQLRIGAAL